MAQELLGQAKGRHIVIRNKTRNADITARLELSDREIMIILAGGKLTYIRSKLKESQCK